MKYLKKSPKKSENWPKTKKTCKNLRLASDLQALQKTCKNGQVRQSGSTDCIILISVETYWFIISLIIIHRQNSTTAVRIPSLKT